MRLWLTTREGNKKIEFSEHTKGADKHAALGRLWGKGGTNGHVNRLTPILRGNRIVLAKKESKLKKKDQTLR